MKFQLVVALYMLFAAAHANAALTLLDKDQWKFSVSGFVEMDAISDSTRSFNEIVGNSAVAAPSSINGQAGRTQFSIRNSRLAFGVDAPETSGWRTKGYLEMDLLGFDSAPPAQGEAAFFNSPTLRVRHAYLSAESGGWQFMAGQYWQLFGFQPYYFMPTVQVAPIDGMLYNRTTQFRAIKTCTFANDLTLQSAIGAFRPPQRDSQLPGLEAGFRLAFAGRTGGFAGGSTVPQKTQPMSIAFTGLAREFVVPANTLAPTGNSVHYPATGMAADILIPVLASPDGKDVSNTLVVGGEFSTGRGYGDQFGGWTGGQANPLSSGTSKRIQEGNVNLDAGLGGFDAAGNFQLVDLRTFNAYFQFHLAAETRTWFSGGYGRLYSDNIGLLTASNGKTGAGNIPNNRQQIYFGNVFHDLTKQLRVAFEFAQIWTQYNDYSNAHNNRYQVSAWFLF